MKRWIHCSSDTNVYGDYVQDLQDNVAPELTETINREIFDPIVDNWVENVLPRLDSESSTVSISTDYIERNLYHCVPIYAAFPFTCQFSDGGPSGLSFVLGAYGWGVNRGNAGLLFLSDIGSGGIGRNKCIRKSSMKAGQKREMNRILDEISSILSDFGFSVIDIVSDPDAYRFVLRED